MSYTRFALGFPRHRKVVPLSDAAFRLWASAMDRSREQASDGLIDDTDLDLVPRCPPKGRKRTELVTELLAAGLWETDSNRWRIHDFLDWQDSAEQIKARRDYSRQRMAELRAQKSRDSALSSANVRANTTITADEVGSGSSYSYSGSGSEIGSGSRRGDARGERAGPPGGEPENTGEDPGRETLCPTDLAAKLEANGTFRRLAEQLPAPIECVRDCVRAFVATWTIGKLAGQKRSGWAGRARQWVIDQNAQGKLRSPGAIAHEGRRDVGVADPDLVELFASVGRAAP